MELFELEKIVMKLNGPVSPVFETREDTQRLQNMKNLIELVDRLLFQIKDAAVYANRQEASAKTIGEHAASFIKAVRAS